MPNREWFQVEKPDGAPIYRDKLLRGTELPNEEEALDLARREAPGCDRPLTVVRYIRQEVCEVEREVSLRETDLRQA